MAPSMPERAPRPGGTREVASDAQVVDSILSPHEISGSSPLVSVAVGRTPNGTGFFLLRQSADKGTKTVTVASFQRRWLEGPMSVEECLTIMSEALRWYIDNDHTASP